MMTHTELAAARAAQDALRADATALGAPFHIKANGRWCRLLRIEGERLVYAAPAKEQRTRRANHKPVFIEMTIAQAQAA